MTDNLSRSTLRGSLPLYKYSNLDSTHNEIRVLVVHPGGDEGPVRTHLRHISLNQPPKYETISYVWGNPKECSTIIVNGAILDIPVSAQRAIRRMRTMHDRVIWIDAVCIDQTDDDEKVEQIPLMTQVYSKSCGNIVWLGKGQARTAAAIGAINAMFLDIKKETNNSLQTFQKILDLGPDRRYSNSLEQCPHDIQALLAFYSNIWFRRIWCVQEVALAPFNTVMFGKFEVSLSTVLQVALWCWHKRLVLGLGDAENPFSFNDVVDGAFKNPKVLASLVKSRSQEQSQRHTHPSSPTLAWMLELSMQYDATKPQDKVFGILGLAFSDYRPDNPLYSEASSQPARIWRLVKPDYEKPLAYVARDATKAAMLQDGGLRILRSVFHDGEADSSGVQFPSWVPRYHEKWECSLDATPFPQDFRPAPAKASETWFSSADLNILHLTGFVVDTVAVVSPVFTDTCLSDMESLINQMKCVIEMVYPRKTSKTPSLRNNASLQETLARTLIAAHANPGDDEVFYPAFAAWHRAIQALPIAALRLALLVTAEDGESCPVAQVETYSDRLTNFCTNRRFFCTTDGFIGLGPREMRPADVVLLSRDYVLPLILRPARRQDDIAQLIGGLNLDFLFRKGRLPNTYSFVGECYVDDRVLTNAIFHGHEFGEDMVFDVL